MVLACMCNPRHSESKDVGLTPPRYNGTSDLQLERMNVYFNEVSYTQTPT